MVKRFPKSTVCPGVTVIGGFAPQPRAGVESICTARLVRITICAKTAYPDDAGSSVDGTTLLSTNAPLEELVKLTPGRTAQRRLANGPEFAMTPV